MTPPTTLLDTHPRIGLAAWQSWFEHDMTGDYPGERVKEIVSHDYERARCKCGGVERRHVTRSRLLVGPNLGQMAFFAHCTCDRCGHGHGSNYRIPWRTA